MDQDMENILAGLVRVGTVSAIDSSRRMARCIFEDLEITSGWLFVLQHYKADIHVEPDNAHQHDIPESPPHTSKTKIIPEHDHPGTHLTYWMPQIGDTVFVLYIPVEDGDGVILGGI